MSLKLVELQVAIPRSQDAGKMQQQLEQRSHDMQQLLQAGMLKEVDKKRIEVSKQEQKKNADLSKEDHSKSRQEHHKKDRQHEQKSDEAARHPYKGIRIDVST
ncbi:hypothetical protein EJF36_09295 [Bacillus sp. HMF5848]|uniref:hypothetical protein n=1 Tax=Bacillus sp. HMF5848 TaxID=2495421 RepID=UPI000F79F74F|nr:hypothetical protein [Bacillus sp. HMF5848]RSK27054.1 hypothetical protein EJF36_09295 [Bacillus sp. HMF5848]